MVIGTTKTPSFNPTFSRLSPGDFRDFHPVIFVLLIPVFRPNPLKACFQRERSFTKMLSPAGFVLPG
jgi:hypothetical protein